jgi:uncharacterized protein (DUF488 family)
MNPKIPDDTGALPTPHARIFTIGYEGRTKEDFLSLLIEKKISTVLDIRHRPFSRKKDFSKTPLKNALAERGIGYVHLPELGVPPDIREQFRQEKDGDILRSFLCESLRQHGDLLMRVLDSHSDGNICLLCLEKDPSCCHRTVVADYLAERHGFEVNHL